MRTIAVISDDLTGAADTGIQFVHAGLRALVLLDLDAGDLPPADVIVGVTESRHDSPELARAKVTGWARELAGRQPEEVYKKIDSTLRGNLGAELDACMSAFPGRLAVFAPAYPTAGRTTKNGRHFMHGVPLEETEVSRDPTTPVRESLIPALLAAQTSHRIGQVRLADMEAGPEALARVLHKEVAEGTEILVCDACTDQHLADLAAAVRSLGRSVIWTGSAGLARQMLPAERTDRPEEAPAATLPLLTVAGSVSRTLRRQIDHYCSTTGAAFIVADSGALTADGPGAMAEVNRVAAEALRSLQAGRSTVITTSVSPEAINPGPAMVETARRIANGLGEITRTILNEGWSGSVILSGGDTALGVCRLLGAVAIQLRAELVPGVALGTLVGGAHENLSVITKAGSFGEVDVLCQISRMIAGPSSPSAWATRPVLGLK